jgi:RimJ/RimL family protein N-acetyltransferase
LTRLVAGPLVLEPLAVAHAEAMYPLLRDPALYRYLDHGPPPSLDHLREVYRKLEAGRSPDGNEIWLNWIVFAGDEPVGTVQATVVGARAWVAYVFGVAHHGKGHARRATAVMIDHLVAGHGVEELLASVEADHARSIRLLEALGFTPGSAAEAAAEDLGPSERLYRRSG